MGVAAFQLADNQDTLKNIVVGTTDLGVMLEYCHILSLPLPSLWQSWISMHGLPSSSSPCFSAREGALRLYQACNFGPIQMQIISWELPQEKEQWVWRCCGSALTTILYHWQVSDSYQPWCMAFLCPKHTICSWREGGHIWLNKNISADG